MFKLMGKKIITIIAKMFCLTGSMVEEYMRPYVILICGTQCKKICPWDLQQSSCQVEQKTSLDQSQNVLSHQGLLY